MTESFQKYLPTRGRFFTNADDDGGSNEHTPLLSTSSLPSVLTDPLPASDVPPEDDERNSMVLNITDSEQRIQEASTSQSAEHLNRRPRRRAAGAQHRHSSSRRRAKRRRTHSDTDLRKMRPLILSPFMPTFATQVSINAQQPQQQERRRTATVVSNALPPTGAPTTNTVIVPRTTGAAIGAMTTGRDIRIVGQSKYGAVPTTTTKSVAMDNNVVAQTIPESEQESGDEDEEESENSSSSGSSSSYTRFSELTKKQWATIGMLAIANLCSTVAFSCIAPFYPTEAEFKGMNTSEIGLVFGIFELVMFVTAPLLGKYMAFFGSKPMFIVGLLITGITAIGFGTLNLLPAGNIFFWASLFIRCAEALGDACFVTSSFAISAKCFPGRIATIVGIMETFAGLGYTAGPVIGSVLYEYGGFQLPFFVLGAMLILATVLSYFLIEEIEDEPTEDAMGMLGMLRIPEIWLMVFAVVICAISLSFFDPTLAGHLASFNLSTIMIGLMFLLCGGFYCVTAPLWGLILDRWHCCNALMLFGSSATVFSMLFVGPSPFIDVDKNLILIGISLAILGIAAGALYIPTFQNCLDAVKDNGYDDSFQTYGCVSGVFQSAFAFGAFIGPTLGGLSVQGIGFPYTTTIIAGVNLIFIIALLTFFAMKRFIGGASTLDGESTKEDPSSLDA